MTKPHPQCPLSWRSIAFVALLAAALACVTSFAASPPPAKAMMMVDEEGECTDDQSDGQYWMVEDCTEPDDNGGGGDGGDDGESDGGEIWEACTPTECWDPGDAAETEDEAEPCGTVGGCWSDWDDDGEEGDSGDDGPSTGGSGDGSDTPVGGSETGGGGRDGSSDPMPQPSPPKERDYCRELWDEFDDIYSDHEEFARRARQQGKRNVKELSKEAQEEWERLGRRLKANELDREGMKCPYPDLAPRRAPRQLKAQMNRIRHSAGRLRGV